MPTFFHSTALKLKMRLYKIIPRDKTVVTLDPEVLITPKPATEWENYVKYGSIPTNVSNGPKIGLVFFIQHTCILILGKI